MALAGRVIASHYAVPATRRVCVATELRSRPAAEADAGRQLASGERFEMLDDSLGWAWGYAGEDRLVGYVRSEALSALS